MKNKVIIAGLALFMVLGLHLAHAEAPSETLKPVVIDNRAALIDAYYHKKHMPLEGYGAKMVAVADKYNLDWRLLPALAVRESSGGLHMCKNNPFGWNSCKTTFTSLNQAIETVGMKLGTLSYYKGKKPLALLQTYNPPSVVPKYAYEVMAIMTSLNAN